MQTQSGIGARRWDASRGVAVQRGNRMLHCNPSTWVTRASATTVMCAALVGPMAFAAPVTLETIAVTPTAKSIAVGQKQSFTARGTFSNRSTQSLGPAIGNIAAGYYDTCALLISGGAECWGDNSTGQLGDGSTVSSSVPRPVNRINSAAAISVGGHHACALLTRGVIQCWGWNYYGQLGNGSTATATTPVAVSAITGATAVDAGSIHNCALLISGAVQCWGSGFWGQLGNGSNVMAAGVPVPVTGISTATALALGQVYSCALLASGTVQCWGDNSSGQLGNGTTTNANTPVTVSGIDSATAIAAGESHACALLASGAVQCWGLNVSGQLGDGSNNDSSIPVTVTGISTAIAITAGGNHNCAVLRNGSVECWGSNYYGQLGNGTTTSSNTPVFVLDINSPTKLGAGDAHTCALLADGAMRCWGRDYYGQLGDGRTNFKQRHRVNVVGTPGVVWQSSDSSKATINDRGVATGRSVGNTTITATTAGFINDNAVLTVK